MHPNAWNGVEAKRCFVRCEELARECDELVPEKGYWGSQIGLDSAKTELKGCLQRAHDEISRRKKFLEHISVGNDNLSMKRAQMSLAGPAADRAIRPLPRR